MAFKGTASHRYKKKLFFIKAQICENKVTHGGNSIGVSGIRLEKFYSSYVDLGQLSSLKFVLACQPFFFHL